MFLHFFTYLVQMATMNVPDAHEVLPGLWLGNRNASQNDDWLREKNIFGMLSATKKAKALIEEVVVNKAFGLH